MNISLIKASIKMFTRWYYILDRLARFYPDASPQCFRGCNLVGSMYHTWWICPRIRSFWNRVFHLLSKVTGVEVPQDPAIALLNHRVDKAPKNTQTLILFMLFGAKITIASDWKKSSVSLWAVKQKVSWIMSQEQIVSKLQDKVQLFESSW